MQYYVYLNGTRRGPLSADRMQRLLADGLLQLSDLACEEPEGEWKPVSAYGVLTEPRVGSQPPQVDPLATALPPPPERRQPTESPPPASPPAAAAELPALSPDSLGPYSRSTLAPNEKPFYKTSLHWIVFARFGIVALLAFLFIAMPFAIAVQAVSGSELGWLALPLPALFLLAPTLAFASSELVITDRRVLIKTGIIRRQTLEMFISKIESVGVDQGFFGRMFDYGTVMIRGTGGFEQPFEAIAQPTQFRSWVQRLQGAG